MTTTFPARVAFEDHRTVRALDLEDEQLYHIERRWQHNLALHSWGILVGLEVQVQNQDRQHPKIIIRPGMALDGYGRELIVTGSDDAAVAPQLFDSAIAYDFWLTYNVILTETDAPMAGFESGEDCCSDWSPTGQPRIMEQPQVLVTRTADRISGSITYPQGVPLEDILSFSPAAPMKFDPAVRWPVFLCRLDFQNGAWQVDNTERHYGGLIAERISAPSTPANTADADSRPTTSVIIGGDANHSDYRFAVLDTPQYVGDKKNHRQTPDSVTAPLSIRTVKPPASEKGAPSRTEIRMEAERVVAESSLILENGAGLLFESALLEPGTLSPTGWGIYRRFGQPPRNRQEKKAEFADALHLSMPKSGQGTNSIAIGSVDNKGDFQEILVVHENESVDIHGVLRVHGAIFGNTTDLPPIDNNDRLADLAGRLPEAMDRSSTEVRTKLVQAVIENAPGERIKAIKTIEKPESRKEIVKEVLGIALSVLSGTETFTAVTKPPHTVTTDDLYDEFVRTALEKLKAQRVYDDLKKDTSTELSDLYKLFVKDAVGLLKHDAVYNELQGGTDFFKLCKVFVQKAVAELGEADVFEALDKTKDLVDRFVDLAAENAVEFVAAIPVDKLPAIVDETFKRHPVDSLDSLTADARKGVWKAGWTDARLLQENAKELPDSETEISTVALAIVNRNLDIATQLRDKLTSWINAGGGT